MEKSVLLVSNDRDFCVEAEALIRSQKFVCVTLNNIPDAYEALKRAYYDLVIIDCVVSARILVKEFANSLLEHNKKVVVAVTHTADWLSLRAHLVFRTEIKAGLTKYFERVSL